MGNIFKNSCSCLDCFKPKNIVDLEISWDQSHSERLLESKERSFIRQKENRETNSSSGVFYDSGENNVIDGGFFTIQAKNKHFETKE